MTLVIACKGPEGFALAADSRTTAAVTMASGKQDTTYTDTATKLFGLTRQEHIGLLSWGQYFFGDRYSVGGFMPQLEARLGERSGGSRMKVADIAGEVGEFFTEQWRKYAKAADNSPIWFLVAGFDEGDTLGRLYQLSIPNAPHPIEQQSNVFGINWGGESELVARVLNGVDPQAAAVAKSELSLRDNQVRRLEGRWRDELGLRIPYDGLPLQSCVDFAVYLVTMTSVGQSFTYGRDRGVGGAVDVATITQANGFQWVRQKQIEVRPPFALPDL